MIVHRTGNLFDSGAEVLVNTVNMQGVMGAGIAQQFRDRYGDPLMAAYKRQLSTGALSLGTPTLVRAPDGQQIMLFPTKDKWREPSKLTWIEQGIISIAGKLDRCGIPSIAMPYPGCGLGGLSTNEVRPILVEHLGPLQCIVYLYGK